jgi:hypothetical protein
VILAYREKRGGGRGRKGEDGERERRGGREREKWGEGRFMIKNGGSREMGEGERGRDKKRDKK